MRFARGLLVGVLLGLVVLVVLSGIPGLSAAYTPSGNETRQTDLILRVGGQDEPKTRNWLPPIANDVWTSDVVFRAYDSFLQGHPETGDVMAYIAKGVDFDEDGMFEPSTEYNVWGEQSTTTTPLEVTVYYDFNGAYFHDGTQMSQWDLFFSYHIYAMCGRCVGSLRQLLPGGITSSYDPSRQLQMVPVDVDPSTPGLQHNWEGEGGMPGSPSLRIAVTYTLTEPYFQFYDDTLAAPPVMPTHIWSRTGGGRHADFGCAVWIPTADANARGIPECGNTDESKWGRGIASTESVPGSTPFRFTGATGAEAWSPRDQDVIGSGPFVFETWVQGVEARVTRFEHYFVGWDTKFTDVTTDDVLLDPALAVIMKKPTIDGIRFLVYKTTQLGVFALQSSEIDYYHWNVPAEFVPDLLKIPEVAVESNAEPGFFYMGYNFRRLPWGYPNNQPSQGDQGYWLRQAISHLVDKQSIVQNLLQNFGVVGHSFVSVANTFWYNDNINKPEFNLGEARAILDDPLRGGVAGVGPDPAGACTKDTPSGCRSLPRLGTGLIEILTPQADYDPIRASSGAMVADAMRQVGLNAVSKPTAFGEIVNIISNPAKNFDIWILGWRITGTDPLDYMYSFWHSINGPSGQNYGGFNDATFDNMIDNARRTIDRTQRRDTYVFPAQQLLADKRPYDILYYRTNIEGYRQDRFVNWTVRSGTIWTFWSLLGIRPPSTVSLRVTPPAVASATTSGGTEAITVTVFDDKSQALSGAAVDVSVNVGSLTMGGACVAQPTCTGTSNIEGKVSATLNAPSVTTVTTVFVTAQATHASFPGAVSTRTSTVQVFPPGAQFLSILVDTPLGDRVTAGSELPMTISVRDQDRVLVSDADVVITVSPDTGLAPSPASGTGLSQVTLTAASTIATETTFTVTVSVTRGAVTADTERQVTVAPPEGGTKLCPDGSRIPVNQQCRSVSTPGLEVLPILAGIGVAALVAGVIAERKRRS